MTREDAKAILKDCLYKAEYKHGAYGIALEMAVKALEQEPKIGHWIDIMVGDMPAQACDQCKTFYPLSYTGGGHNYCPNCGAKMVDEQESEGWE
jgi:PHP family Zn ribbon phosphoesterase